MTTETQHTAQLFTGKTDGITWSIEISESRSTLDILTRDAVVTAAGEDNYIADKYRKRYLNSTKPKEIIDDLLYVAGVVPLATSKRLIHKSNWSEEMHWYFNGVRVIWWDKRIKSWTSFLVDGQHNQRTPAEYYANKWQFMACEDMGLFDDDADKLRYAIEVNSWG